LVDLATPSPKATATRTYPATDLSVGGTAKSPGRWINEKEPVIYDSQTIAIAVLETAAHVDDAGLPLNRYLIELDVPDDVWAQREEVDMASLPVTWSAIPAGNGSASVGSRWLVSKSSPILLAPSVIVPEERASLINPLHPESSRIKARIVRLFEYSRLFRS